MEDKYKRNKNRYSWRINIKVTKININETKMNILIKEK